MQVKFVAGAVFLMAVLGACADAPTAPKSTEPSVRELELLNQTDGTGLVLQSLTGVTLPLIGQIGDVVIDQAVITHLVLVEDVVGNIVGLQAEGVLTLTGGVLGTDVVEEEFLTSVQFAKSGQGCSVLTVDLAPITIDALGTTVSVDAPVAVLNARSRGIAGGLLCSLSQALLQPPTNGITRAIRAIVDAINRILI